MLGVELTATVALELYRDKVIDRDELRRLFGIPSTEKPERKWRVGESVEGVDEYNSLPIGTVVGDLERVLLGFRVGPKIWRLGDVYSRRVIKSLPDD